MNWQTLVKERYPKAVCVKLQRNGSFYTVFDKPGGKVLARAYSAIQAWKNVLRKMLSL